MKNKYFGDTRDLFKYDLILKITQEVVSIHRFLFIPMLTSDDDSSDGNKTNYIKAKAGTQNKELMTHLKDCVNRDRRNIMEIEPYFKSNGVEIYIHEELFIHINRRNYFGKVKIKKEFFSNSLVFVDPDKGLEIQQSKEKHFLYREAKDIYDYMDGNSILMIYQHFPHENHKEYLHKRTNKLENLTGDSPIYISDNNIIFFLLTKSGGVKDQLKGTINKYKRHYPKLIAGNVFYNRV